MMGVFMAPVSAIPTGEIATDFPLLIWDLLRIKQPRMYRCGMCNFYLKSTVELWN